MRCKVYSQCRISFPKVVLFEKRNKYNSPFGFHWLAASEDTTADRQLRFSPLLINLQNSNPQSAASKIRNHHTEEEECSFLFTNLENSNPQSTASDIRNHQPSSFSSPSSSPPPLPSSYSYSSINRNDAYTSMYTFEPQLKGPDPPEKSYIRLIIQLLWKQVSIQLVVFTLSALINYSVLTEEQKSL